MFLKYNFRGVLILVQTFSYEKTLLGVLEEQLGIVSRRIARTGVSYFAVSRFSAIVEVYEGNFIELLAAAAAEPALEAHVKTVKDLESRIVAMVKEFPQLSLEVPRSERVNKRAGVLIEEIFSAAKARDPNTANWTISDLEAEAEAERSQFMDLWKSADE